VIIFVPAPVFAPVPVFAPAPVFAPEPVVEVKKPQVETVTVNVVLPPVITPDPVPVPAELTTQKQQKVVEEPVVELAPEKIFTKITVPKLAPFKGTGPFKFALALVDQEDATAIKDPELAIGLKVFSQTPSVCRVSATFNKSTGKYAISVTGISNGQCKITAVDKGSDEKSPAVTEIKQMINGITTKSVSVKGIKPTPAPKAGIKKASYKPAKG
jgi:hypothetical protein